MMARESKSAPEEYCPSPSVVYSAVQKKSRNLKEIKPYLFALIIIDPKRWLKLVKIFKWILCHKKPVKKGQPGSREFSFWCQ